jgi:hypothetical protein
LTTNNVKIWRKENQRECKEEVMVKETLEGGSLLIDLGLNPESRKRIGGHKRKLLRSKSKVENLIKKGVGIKRTKMRRLSKHTMMTMMIFGPRDFVSLLMNHLRIKSI